MEEGVESGRYGTQHASERALYRSGSTEIILVKVLEVHLKSRGKHTWLSGSNICTPQLCNQFVMQSMVFPEDPFWSPPFFLLKNRIMVTKDDLWEKVYLRHAAIADELSVQLLAVYMLEILGDGNGKCKVQYHKPQLRQAKIHVLVLFSGKGYSGTIQENINWSRKVNPTLTLDDEWHKLINYFEKQKMEASNPPATGPINPENPSMALQASERITTRLNNAGSPPLRLIPSISSVQRQYQ
jgi:hypothetical protein